MQGKEHQLAFMHWYPQAHKVFNDRDGRNFVLDGICIPKPSVSVDQPAGGHSPSVQPARSPGCRVRLGEGHQLFKELLLARRGVSLRAIVGIVSQALLFFACTLRVHLWSSLMSLCKGVRGCAGQ